VPREILTDDRQLMLPGIRGVSRQARHGKLRARRGH
jgi:hypothetical protein